VQEQGVSADIEMDGLDSLSTTRHFLAYESDVAIATGRILGNGKIGRLCVIDGYRGKGYGKKLLGTMLFHALESYEYDQLFLNAQLTALPLYEKCGFVAEGPIFDEAGIEHRRMSLSLSTSTSLLNIYGDRVMRYSFATDFTHHLSQMINVGTRTLNILTANLSPEVFTEKVAQSVSYFARSHRQSLARILVQNTTPLAASNHPLVRLHQRLPSSVHIRALTELPKKPEQGFTTVDNTHIVFFNNENELEGFINYQARAECAQQQEQFDNLWQRYSAKDPNLSRLTI